MKGNLRVIFLILMLAVIALAQSEQHQPATTAVDEIQAFIGVWRGEIKQHPAVEVHLKKEEGKLTGTAIFYPLSDEETTPSPNIMPELLLNDLRVTGRSLSFTWNGPDGSRAKVELKLVSETDAELKSTGDAGIPDEMKVIKMVKARS